MATTMEEAGETTKQTPGSKSVIFWGRSHHTNHLQWSPQSFPATEREWGGRVSLNYSEENIRAFLNSEQLKCILVLTGITFCYQGNLIL